MMTNNELFRSFPEIRSMVVELSNEGVSIAKISKTIGMPASVIYRWRKDAMIKRLIMQNSENLRARNDMIRRLNFLRHSELIQGESEDPYGSGDTLLATS